MKRISWMYVSALGGILLTCASTGVANADEWNKKTYVTISQSIEVPGAILAPGKYVFKLLDSQANRHIVQILNDRENHVYSTNFAIPKQRMEPADKTILTFYEMPGGGPEPIRAWFYPGDTIGQEFLYPKRRAQEIAMAMRNSGVVVAQNRTPEPAPVAASETPAPAVEPDTSANRVVEPTPESTPAPAAEPTPTPEASASVPDNASAEPTPAPTPAPVETPAEPEMPHTAGNLVAVGLLGFSCLGLAASLQYAGRRAGSRS